MKRKLKYISIPLVLISVFTGCKKFSDINKDPYLATADQVQVEYFINNAIVSSQMDPHIAERVFVLYWKTAGRQQFGGGISTGGYNDGWSSDYYGTGFMGGWLNAINSGVQVAEEQLASGNIKEYTSNLLQISRIWRAYLMSELTDNFGPIPINAFQGVNPEFADVKSVYYFLLDELKDASGEMDIALAAKPEAKYDQAYGFDYAKWQKFANSLRLRLSMRLSEVDATKAKSEFEAAASLPLITSTADMFQVAELNAWSPLAGVMSREWNHFQMPATYNNLVLGLGGIQTSAQGLGADKLPYIKPADYVGLRLLDHMSTLTNDPLAGYWLDGLPHAIDPRAYKTYIIPGDVSNPQFNTYGGSAATTTTRNLMAGTDPDAVVKTIDAKFHWNGVTNGDFGTKGTKNQLRSYIGTTPRHAHKFRNSQNKRVYFGPWESYFLLAEAAVRTWTVPMTGQAAYEAGIDASFAYWEVTSFAGAYKTSTDYNFAGTSVSWTHTTEPGASHAMNYTDGYTNANGVVNIAYPVNSLYKNGTVRNDQLTKIITQKFIAQNPWLPLETWNDHRRLGLPFFENPAIERPLTNLPALTTGNYMTSNIKFFPQRLKYPSGIEGNNKAGYDQAVTLLGGTDDVLTPLWWAKH